MLEEDFLVESLGVKLRTAREAKKYTVEQVCRDTNIASRYIDALEKEDFSVFPGEPYLLGFLRNYGEYLGLETEDLLASYRAQRIQEIPIPVEQLLHSPPQTGRIIRIIVIILVILGAAGGGFYWFWTRPAPVAVVPVESRPAAEYLLEESFLERRLYVGDSVLIPLNGERYRLELIKLEETLSIGIPAAAPVILDLGQEAGVDLNNDSRVDVRITAADFEKNEGKNGALLRFDMDYTPSITESGEIFFADPAAGRQEAVQTTASVVFTSPNAYPFTIQASFQGYCMFRWEILGERDRSGRNEQYFQRSDELDIQAQNGIRVWLSNAAAVKIQVIGGGRTVPLEIGGPGEVIVADIRWVRDEEGRFRLAMFRLD
jgi:cytoskeletal protein RodZ